MRTFGTSVYYAGFDPGSGVATLWVSPADGIELAHHTLSVPSFVGDGDAARLLDSRSRIAGQTLSQVLQPEEYVLNLNGQDYYVGSLAIRDGDNETNALGDKFRYGGQHSQLLLLALAAALIPEQDIELRLVTALPVSLYDKENRLRVKQGLQGNYRFTFNGQPREITVKVGAVVMEGQGVLVHCSSEEYDEQAVIDIGERTTDLVAIDASGNPLRKFCAGRPLGVGQVVDELQETIRGNYGRLISPALAHKLLRAYAQSETLPPVRVNGVNIPEDYVSSIIYQAIERVGRSILTFISSSWNVEGATIGSNFDAIYIAGGGAYYFADIIRGHIPAAERVGQPEHANVQGYHDLALGLETVKATIWE